MKRVTKLRIIGSDKICRELLYEPYKDKIPKEFSKYQYSGGQLNLPLEPDSLELQQAIQIAQEYNLHPTLISEVCYTKAELEQIKYFHLHVLSPFELEGKDAADYGTQYRNGCPNCGLGKKIVGDALVDRKLMKKYDMGQMLPDVYVSKSVRDLIVENEFTGVSFDHKIKDYKGREMANYYVLSVHNILPPMSDETWLRIEDHNANLEECGHQTIYLRSDHKYEHEKLANVQDFNLTYEYLNGLRLRDVIVSARVRKVFGQNKVHAGFFPVAVL